MAKSKLSAYRVRFVVYDVMDVVVEVDQTVSEWEIVAAAVRRAEREHPMVAWQVDEDTVEVFRHPIGGEREGSAAPRA